MSKEKQELHTNGYGGIYVKIIDNLTKSDIQIKVREWPNKSLSIDAGETDVPADFPLAWASNPNDEGKCTLIEIPGVANLLLWDDKTASAFYSKNGHWSISGLKPAGTQNSWGDYKLIIKENGNLRMDKIN